MAVRGTISSFTAGGKSVKYSKRAGVPLTPLGVLDPATGKVYQKPRLKAEQLGGRSVRITAPRASLNGSRNTMTGSMGMGGVGQRGRNRDVGSAKARAEA
jgi:predicted aconitase with swiveling domain